MFSCCSADDGYEKLGRGNMDPREEATAGDIDQEQLDELADMADVHIAQPDPVVEVIEEKEEEIYIDVISDDEDNDANAPIGSWGVARILENLGKIGNQPKRKEQVTIAKYLSRFVELCEATQPARQILEARGLDLVLRLLPKFDGVLNIQISICNAIQFLCLKSFAGEELYEFPDSGAAALKNMVVACQDRPNALIAALDCLGVFARVRDDYAQSTIDTGIVPVLYEMIRANFRQDSFPLVISLTRVVVSISRTEGGRSALGDNCVDLLMDTMKNFKDVQDLVGNCTEALWYLCKVQENCFKMLDNEITVILTETMRNKYVGQDLHTKIITLLHQIVSQDGVPDRFVGDDNGLDLLSELFADNGNMTENYIVVLQVWITLLAHLSQEKREQLIDGPFASKAVEILTPVLGAEQQDAREAALTLLLIVIQTNSNAINMIAEQPNALGGLLQVFQQRLSADGIQCLMVLYYRLCGSLETQAFLFDNGIMDVMASDWHKVEGVSGEAIKSAAAALIRLYANTNYHQLLDDKVPKLKTLVALKSEYDDAATILDELDAALDRIREASSVFVTVAAPESDEKEAGEGVALKGGEVNVKLAVGQPVEVYSKSQGGWIGGTIRAIADGRICVVYSNREKWLKQTSKQWRPMTEQIEQAARTRSGTTARRKQEEEKDTYGQDEEPSQDYANAEPGAATEMGAAIPDLGTDFMNAQDVINRTANQRLDSPRPPDSAVARPQTRRATRAADDEMDYDVEFSTGKLGLELRPGENTNNCVVSSCLNRFTEQRIDEDAYIVQVNGQWVKDLPFDTIYQIIVTATRNPPLTIMFRSKKDDGDQERINALVDKNAMGTLKVHVVEANQLVTRARYAKVKLSGEKQQTTSVSPSENPQWSDTLEFANYRPENGRSATVVIYSQNRLLKDNKVGQVDFELPSTFYKLERNMNVPLLDKKGKLAGSVSVTAILTESTMRESHRIRDNVAFSMPVGDSMALSEDER